MKTKMVGKLILNSAEENSIHFGFDFQLNIVWKSNAPIKKATHQTHSKIARTRKFYFIIPFDSSIKWNLHDYTVCVRVCKAIEQFMYMNAMANEQKTRTIEKKKWARTTCGVPHKSRPNHMQYL